MKEIWKPIGGYEGLYEVSSFGRVRSVDRMIYHSGFEKKIFRHGKILKPGISKYGYYRVRLSKGDKGTVVSIHRLVGLAFLNNPNNYSQINHKDENKKNNCVNNLEWCDAKYNVNYGTRNQRLSESMKGKNKGKRPSIRTEFKPGHVPWMKGKSNIWAARAVRCVNDGKVFSSMKEASENYGITPQNVYDSCKNNCIRKGFLFKYV